MVETIDGANRWTVGQLIAFVLGVLLIIASVAFIGGAYLGYYWPPSWTLLLFIFVPNIGHLLIAVSIYHRYGVELV